MRVYLLTAVVLLPACGYWPEDAMGEACHSIVIGYNDLVPAEEDGRIIPARYGPLLDAIGMLEPSGCTAVHIGQGVVLTAGHCVALGSGDCSDIQIRWALRGQREGIASTCTSVLAAQRDFDADYAALQVDPVPNAAIPIEACSEPAPGTAITMFSHPGRRPLEWSDTCMVEAGATGGRGVFEFAHACDAEDGSSGAPVIDDNSLRLVGIHDGGIAPWNYGTFLSPLPFFNAAREACWCGAGATAESPR